MTDFIILYTGVPISVLLQKDATGNYIENSVLEDNSKLEVTLSGIKNVLYKAFI